MPNRTDTFVTQFPPKPRANFGGVVTRMPNEGAAFPQVALGSLFRAASKDLFTFPSLFGISNAWSLSFQFTLINLTADFVLLDIGTNLAANNNNRITITHQGSVANDPIQIQLFDSAGTLFKSFTFNLAAHNVGLVQHWHHMTVTWDGSSLKLYMVGSLFADTARATDIAGTQTDTSRVMSVGGSLTTTSILNSWVGAVCMWNSALAANEVASLYNAQGDLTFNPTVNFVDYVSSANLVHFWATGGSSDYADLAGNIVCPDQIGSTQLGGTGTSGNPCNYTTNSQAPISAGGGNPGKIVWNAPGGTHFGNSTNKVLGIINAWTLQVHIK